MRTTPEIFDTVVVVSADTSLDQKSGASFYTLRIGLPPDQLAHLAGLKLVPGVPVEAFIQTDERTAMSFLIKPLQDQIAKAFRER
jgi:HlyD family secretion protein